MDHDDLSNPAILFGFLDVWLNNNATTAKDKDRINQSLLDQLAFYASNAEILTAIRSFRPKYTRMSIEDAKQINRAGWRRIVEGPEYAEKHQYDKMETIFKEFMGTPFPKGKRDASWLKRADSVRQISRDFWRNCREVQLVRLAKPGREKWTKEDVDDQISLLSFDSSAEHIAALQAERDTILAPIFEGSIKTEKLKATSFTDWNSQPTGEDQFLPFQSVPKLKIKSRPIDKAESKSAALVAAFEDVAIKEQPPVPRLVLKAETVRVLTRMFPITAEEYAAKPMEWRSFVIAMEDAGFPATHSGGSAVTFLQIGGNGRIIFHRPHPVAKIDQIMLQGFGKRMRKWFGWEKETFVCKKKDDEQLDGESA